MDSSRAYAYKTRAIKKRKGQRFLSDFILYSLTTLACTSFCSSPLWYPPFCATFNVFFFFSLPKITSFFFTSKALLIVGNLIIIFLLSESKFFYHDKYAGNRLDRLQIISPTHEQKPKKTVKETNKNVNLILESKTRDQDNDHEEFFELSNDDEICDNDVGQMAESFGHDNEEDLSCSKQEMKVVEEEKLEGLEGDHEDVSYPPEELNKLVDDFIAKINRQRRLEAEIFRG